MAYYANPIMCGLNKVINLDDGHTVELTWYKAYPNVITNLIAYNIYYSTSQSDVFAEGPKYVVIDDVLRTNIPNLTPGQDYWFSVRPVEYDPTIITFFNNLPCMCDNLRYYPNSILSQNMTATDLIVPLLDVECFPPTGIVKVGIELILYTVIDYVNKNLIVPPNGNPTGASLVLQSNDEYYLPNPDNTGAGTLNNLMLVNTNPPAETWNILCVFVEQDANGNPIRGTAKFEAIGNISGSCVDQYGNFIVWQANGIVVSNGILSFSITETSQFKVGDSFKVQNTGYTNADLMGRGFNNTPITLHDINGFDGYNYWDPCIKITAITEDTQYDNIYACQVRFDYPHFPFTILDGYKQITQDILSTDLSAADAANVGFPMYDYAGYHRTDPVQLLTGICVGSYIGGQNGCIDAYGNYNIYRGLNLEDQNTQRQDILLSVTGRVAVLLKRRWTGTTCACYLPLSEYPDDRCPKCNGGKIVQSWEQYFNPRRSDGRILVRVSPTPENLKMHDAGLESEFPLDMWTLTVPTIKTRDIIILFDQDDNEEFRYEVSNVFRNNTIVGLDGGQHMNTFRIRKTDPAYQIRTFENTENYPTSINTSLTNARGFGPHLHSCVVSIDKTISISQINQLSGISSGHQHVIINGKIMPFANEDGEHTHTLILPQFNLC